LIEVCFILLFSRGRSWINAHDNAGLRIADKRSLPCPNRDKWLAARDELYEEIMNKAWNKEGRYFGQSYEETDVLDSAVLIMPLVFFIQAVSSRIAVFSFD
jgi:GH15 family glucan-1,4-alpha-glucosidase